jgi:hypothetical protein
VLKTDLIYIHTKFQFSITVYDKYTYEICPKSKCTDFPLYDLGRQHLGVYWQVGNNLGCVYILIFLCMTWEGSTSLMYIGELVITLAACTYMFKLDQLSLS